MRKFLLPPSPNKMNSPLAEKEKKNKRVAFFTSLSIHTAIAILFFFLVAWKEPNPPLSLPGIEINLGFDDQGGGEIQPEETPGTEAPAEVEPIPEENPPQEESKEVSVPEETTVSKTESPVVVKEQKKDPAIEKPKDKVAEVKPAEQKTETKTKVETEATKVVTDSKKGKNAPSQGDDAGKTGDKGNPEGKPDANALYGKPGGGGGGDGISLDMGGWAWADQPKIPDLPDNEDGKIEFEIECDETGEITAINTLQRGLSPRAEQLLKAEIRKNSLVRTSNGKVPERSKGKVVFVLKTK
jgi:periplasmic protein TonB